MAPLLRLHQPLLPNTDLDVQSTRTMAALRVSTDAFHRRALSTLASKPLKTPSYTCIFCQSTRTPFRRFTASARQKQEGGASNGGPFGTRLRASLRKTKVEWKPIPVALGIGFLGAAQFYRIRQREKRQREEEAEEARLQNEESKGRPKKRERIKPSGPW